MKEKVYLKGDPKAIEIIQNNILELISKMNTTKRKTISLVLKSF